MFLYSDPTATGFLEARGALAEFREIIHDAYRDGAKVPNSVFTVLEAFDALPAGVMSWKFQGSSASMTALDPTKRARTCTGCHVNGAPIMKELLRPWNNWHSIDDSIAHLRPGRPISRPVAIDPKTDGRLTGAEQLEGMIIRGVNRLNQRRVDAAILPGSTTGDRRVENAVSMLRSLFMCYSAWNIDGVDASSRRHRNVARWCRSLIS